MFSSLFGSRPKALSAQPVEGRVEGNTAFALDLYAQLKAQPGNLFFSPYSISTCLAMAYAGARGETETQMGRVLHFGADQGQLHAAYSALQRQLTAAGQQPGLELNIANALWAQKGHPFLPAFLHVAQGEYQANVNQADFATSAETAREEINRWVAGQTKDKIQTILPPGSLDAMTRLVLADAIYFKGTWTKRFDKARTSNQPFHLSPASQVQVPLMHQTDQVNYMENDDFQAVELPYKDGALAMVILLPRQLEGVGALEAQFTPLLLSNSLSRMKKQNVEIFLPRFKLESRFELNRTLAAMGMVDAFGPNANFSGIDGIRDLYISAVFHKAWGEVNEEGTEAAAATTTTFRAMAVHKPPPPPPVFRADHPCLFLIRDTHSGSLLFLGRLSHPAQ